MKDAVELQNKIGVEFQNKDLIREALTHRSFLNENPNEKTRHNERLEFLGDAVLELATTKFLFNKYPEKPEGELTSLRAALVNANALFDVASALELEKYLRLSKGEAKDSGKGKQAIMANAIEAIIGAVYLDKGYDAAEKFVNDFVCAGLENVMNKKLWRDAKSLFQEKAQELLGVTPTYGVLSETGPDHMKNFLVGAYIDEEMVATGEGSSKQEAQQKAAEEALNKKGWNT
jgi:ribonuclease-3